MIGCTAARMRPRRALRTRAHLRLVRFRGVALGSRGAAGAWLPLLLRFRRAGRPRSESRTPLAAGAARATLGPSAIFPVTARVQLWLAQQPALCSSSCSPIALRLVRAAAPRAITPPRSALEANASHVLREPVRGPEWPPWSVRSMGRSQAMQPSIRVAPHDVRADAAPRRASSASSASAASSPASGSSASMAAGHEAGLPTAREHAERAPALLRTRLRAQPSWSRQTGGPSLGGMLAANRRPAFLRDTGRPAVDAAVRQRAACAPDPRAAAPLRVASTGAELPAHVLTLRFRQARRTDRGAGSLHADRAPTTDRRALPAVPTQDSPTRETTGAPPQGSLAGAARAAAKLAPAEVEQLAELVMRRIDKRLRVERERRGM